MPLPNARWCRRFSRSGSNGSKRALGDGSVLYNTLDHCRGHYDMVPVLDYYPVIERCSWDRPVDYELRRSLRWAGGEGP
jgi:hypothetical protein